MQYAFFLDAAACSGCKACQVACQDKHALPPGVWWRRVYEVSGGGWRAQGGAWRQDAFAFNLSLACHHCERPICVEVCPARALQRRPDGIVLLDRNRCLGCHYCEWACPYGAPQYDPSAGVMTKCTACADEIEIGKPPACVAACGLRALDFGTPGELVARYGSAADVVPNEPLAPASFPLPDPALTRPGLLLRAHRHAARAHSGAARVANLEEVKARPARARREISLVAFTLLVQLAVGLFWAWLALNSAAPPAAGSGVLLLAAGPLLLAGAASSLLHLGSPSQAWRALANLRTSWLSREILLIIAFGAGWTLVLALQRYGEGLAGARAALAAAVGLLGFALVYAMARVYRLRTVPPWNTVRTFHSFLLTAIILGALAAALLRAAAGGTGGTAVLPALLFVAAVAAAVVFRLRFYAGARAGL